MEEKDDWTCGREGDRHPCTQTDLQDEFITPIMILRTYISRKVKHKFLMLCVTLASLNAEFLWFYITQIQSYSIIKVRYSYLNMIFRFCINLRSRVCWIKIHSFSFQILARPWQRLHAGKPIISYKLYFIFELLI